MLLSQLIVTQNSYCKFFEQNILNIQYSVDATIKLNIYDNLYIDFLRLMDVKFMKNKNTAPKS